ANARRSAGGDRRSWPLLFFAPPARSFRACADPPAPGGRFAPRPVALPLHGDRTRGSRVRVACSWSSGWAWRSPSPRPVSPFPCGHTMKTHLVRALAAVALPATLHAPAAAAPCDKTIRLTATAAGQDVQADGRARLRADAKGRQSLRVEV